MSRRRRYRRFAYRGANLRICCRAFARATAEVVRQRELLEAYIRRHPAFGTSLRPLPARADAPEVARRMARAAEAAGVGPMAAVAGAMAQIVAEAAREGEGGEAIVENGGDLYAVCERPLRVGLYVGDSELSGRLALAVRPEDTPIAICSSSSTMGHSMSFGACDLATVVARDAALADAAATRAANLVRSAEDIEAALAAVRAIRGVEGILLVLGGRVGLAGRLPELVAARDAELELKVTRDPDSLQGGAGDSCVTGLS